MTDSQKVIALIFVVELICLTEFLLVGRFVALLAVTFLTFIFLIVEFVNE